MKQRIVEQKQDTDETQAELADWFGYVLFSTLIILIAFVAAPWAHFLASH